MQVDVVVLILLSLADFIYILVMYTTDDNATVMPVDYVAQVAKIIAFVSKHVTTT